ncbi:MAG: OB-fold nucleic acid binding domain-containing protein, partial [Planctomycetaceae bacterium]
VFGLGAIKGVGEHSLNAIVAERIDNGEFTNVFELCDRLGPRVLNRSTLETLVKAGALDSLGPHRAQHLLLIERALQSAISKHRDRERGQKSLFGEDDPAEDDVSSFAVPDVPDWPQRQRLAHEKEAFGFYLTSHPLAEFGRRLQRHVSHSLKQIAELEDRTEVLVGGMITSIKKAATKKPNRNGHTRYVNFDFDDSAAILRCIMWPEEFASYGDRVHSEAICFVKGRVDRRGREPNIVVNRLFTVEEAEKEFTQQLAIKFQRGLHSVDDMVRVREALRRFPGKTDVVLVVDSAHIERQIPRRRYILTTPDECRVSCSGDLRSALEGLLGEEHFQFHSTKRRRLV